MAGSSLLRSVIRAEDLLGYGKKRSHAGPYRPPQASARRPILGGQLALTDGALRAELGRPPNLARFLVMAALAQLLPQTAPFQQPLEAAQGRTNRFLIKDTHS